MVSFGNAIRIEKLEKELDELKSQKKALTDALNDPEAKKPRTEAYYNAHANLRIWQTKVNAIVKELKEIRGDNL